MVTHAPKAQNGRVSTPLPLAQRFLLDDTYFAPLAAGRNVLPDHHAYSYANALNSAAQAYVSTGSR